MKIFVLAFSQLPVRQLTDIRPCYIMMMLFSAACAAVNGMARQSMCKTDFSAACAAVNLDRLDFEGREVFSAACAAVNARLIWNGFQIHFSAACAAVNSTVNYVIIN